MKTSRELKTQARAALKGNWGPAVVATIAYVVVTILCTAPTAVYQLSHPNMQQELVYAAQTANYPAMTEIYAGMYRWNGISSLLQLFVMSVVALGFANAFLRLVRNGDTYIAQNTFRIAFSNYMHKVLGMFLMGIFIFLWSLLFIIPGIIKIFSYAMTPYILDEYPDLGCNDAIDLSRKMMKGHKLDLFILGLSFIGWFLLCLLTLGIGFLWLTPYMSAANAAFYEDVKAEYLLKNNGILM